MWRISNAMVSHVALYFFDSESTFIFLSPTTTALPRQADPNNVSSDNHNSSPVRKRKAHSNPSCIGEQQWQSPPPKTVPAGEDDLRHVPSRIFQRQLPRPAIRQVHGVGTPAATDQSGGETTTSVLLSTEPLGVGGSATTHSWSGTVWTGSSSGELTTTPSYAVFASDVDETPTQAPPTLTTDPPSSVPAVSDITATEFSSTITPSHASIPSSAISSSSSEDHPLSPSQPASTSRSLPTSSKTSFTEQESTVLSITSSTPTQASGTNTILSTSTTNTRSRTTTASPPPATVRGSTPTNLPPRTTGITTTTPSTISSTPSPESPSSRYTTSTVSPSSTYITSPAASSFMTHITNTPSTGSSSSTNSIRTVSRKCWANPIGTTCPPTMRAGTTRLSYTSLWTTSPTSTSRFSNPLSSSSTTAPLTTPGFSTTTWSNTVPVIASSTTSSNRTSSITIETGALRTDTSNSSAFAMNTGGIIGVSLAATTSLIFLVLFLFFACRRYRRHRMHTGSTDNILTLAREVSWRRPVDGDDDSYEEKGRSLPPTGSLEHSVAGTHEAFGSTSAGEHLSSGHGSAESGNAVMAPPMNTVFGGQPHPTYDQSMQGAIALVPTVMTAAFLSEPANFHDGPQISSNPYRHVHAEGIRSAASLTLAGESSSSREGTGSLSSSEETSRRLPDPKRQSLSGPRPMGSTTSHRHSSTPPTAFIHQPLFDHERHTQPSEQSDRMSVKSFISRLRNGRRTSAQSVSTVRGPSFSQSRESDVPSTVAAFSPSLLNPPVAISPPHPILTFPRGITGNSYTPPGSQRADGPASGHSSVLWPPVTLPPSPAATDNSSMAEGLLHPRLALSQGQSHQASMTSLRDHEDYTRPINGLINNHLRSTTTFGTQDTTESEEGKDSVRS